MTHRVLALFAFSLLTSAQPQPNSSYSPRADKDSQPKNQIGGHSPATQHPSIEDSRAEAAGQTTTEVDKGNSENRLADYTRQLAIYTLLLAVVGILQFFALGIQATALHHHSGLIRDSVNQMRQAVSAYQDFARTSENMLALTRLSNETMRQSTELTRQSLILTHRPKLVIRHIALEDEDLILRWRSVPGGGGADEFIPRGTMRLVNVGASDANIVSLCCGFFAFENLPLKSPLPFDPAASAFPGLRVPSGVYAPFGVPFGMKQEPFGFKVLNSIDRGEKALYVIGEIVYLDDLNNRRTTYFCREWRAQKPYFMPVGDADYEAAD